MLPSSFSAATGAVAALLMSAIPSALAQNGYSLDTKDDIIKTSKQLAEDLLAFYEGDQPGKIPGILPGPPHDGLGDYYWWQGGAMMGTLIDYWKLTGDTTYNDIVMQGIVHNVGENRDFQPTNHTGSLGNDDQGFWGMTAMLAAENKFPDPPEDQPQWLALAQATWVTQASPERHDDDCGGGMRWQVPSFNVGYDYKNTIANGIFMNLGARLARYTGNDSYIDYCETTWNWLWELGYIDNDNWKVYDGAHDYNNCTEIDKATYSYNFGVMLQNTAFLYNYTEESKWLDRFDKILERGLKDFFADGALFELPCERRKKACSADMLMFKGFAHRWMAVCAQLVPERADEILPVLRKSAEKAIAQCTGGESGRVCGFYWTEGEFWDPPQDGTTGAGEQMNVLAAVSSLLIEDVAPPVTNSSGGTSRGDPDAGSHSDVTPKEFPDLTTADRAGAGIITVIILGGALSAWAWMNMG